MSSCTVSLRSLFLRRSQSFSPSFRNYLLMSIVEVWSDSPKLKQSFFFFFLPLSIWREKNICRLWCGFFLFGITERHQLYSVIYQHKQERTERREA